MNEPEPEILFKMWMVRLYNNVVNKDDAMLLFILFEIICLLSGLTALELFPLSKNATK